MVLKGYWRRGGRANFARKLKAKYHAHRTLDALATIYKKYFCFSLEIPNLQTTKKSSSKKDKGLFRCERVLKIRFNYGLNKKEYLNKWENYSDSFNSWETVENIF